MLPTTHLLYLHGFRSSPQSTKAQQLGHRVRSQHPGVHWWCPALPVSPRAAMVLLDGVAHDPKRQRHWAIVVQGEEVLDWREMQAFCAHATVRLLPGSDHALSDFEQHMNALVDFLNLATESPPKA